MKKTTKKVTSPKTKKIIVSKVGPVPTEIVNVIERHQHPAHQLSERANGGRR